MREYKIGDPVMFFFGHGEWSCLVLTRVGESTLDGIDVTYPDLPTIKDVSLSHTIPFPAWRLDSAVVCRDGVRRTVRELISLATSPGTPPVP